MTIDTKPIGSGQVQNIGVERTNKQKDTPSAQPQGSSVQPGTADKVTLTGDAERLRHLEEAVNQTSGVDSKKVESIRTAIAEGKFEIDSEKIATKLLDLEQQLNR